MTGVRCCLIVLILGAVCAPPTHAHDLWVVKTGNEYVVARGTAPEKMEPYDPQCVKEFFAVASDGTMIPPDRIQRMDEAKRVRFRMPHSVSLIGVSCDWGYRVNTTKGKKLLTRQDAETAGFRVIDSFFSTQCAKVLFNEGVAVQKPIGMKFELVPLENPLSVSVGERLPIRAFFDGKPLAGIAILTKYGDEFATDTMGVGHMKMTKKGLQLLMARHKVPMKDDPEKDYRLYTTFFVFEAE